MSAKESVVSIFFIYTCTLCRKDIGLQFGSKGLVFCACTTDKNFNGCQRSQCLNVIFDTSYLFECNLDKHGILKQGNIKFYTPSLIKLNKNYIGGLEISNFRRTNPYFNILRRFRNSFQFHFFPRYVCPFLPTFLEKCLVILLPDIPITKKPFSMKPFTVIL